MFKFALISVAFHYLLKKNKRNAASDIYNVEQTTDYNNIVIIVVCAMKRL